VWAILPGPIVHWSDPAVLDANVCDHSDLTDDLDTENPKAREMETFATRVYQNARRHPRSLLITTTRY